MVNISPGFQSPITVLREVGMPYRPTQPPNLTGVANKYQPSSSGNRAEHRWWL